MILTIERGENGIIYILLFTLPGHIHPAQHYQHAIHRLDVKHDAYGIVPKIEVIFTSRKRTTSKREV